MQRQIIVRDYQEFQAQDVVDMQDYVRTSFDTLANDVVTTTRRFAGFTTVKTAQTEVQVQSGRFYDVDGAVYARTTTLVQSLMAYLPATAGRYVSIVASGAVSEAGIEDRDFIVDAETDRIEPDAVSTIRSRDAVLSIVSGTEAADPQYPIIGVNTVEICRILLDPTQVVSVTMMTANRVASTEALDVRVAATEAFDNAISPRVTALASDLAALTAKIASLKTTRNLDQVYQDVALMKDLLKVPDTHADYGADHYLSPMKSDYNNTQSLGYDAKVEEGIRFSDANATAFEISLFSNSDPNAALSGGFLLPAYDEAVVLTNWRSGFIDAGSIGIAQYGYQNFTLTQGMIHNERIRYGGAYFVCSNGAQWAADGTAAPIDLLDFSTWASVETMLTDQNPGHLVTRYDYYWHDSWNTPYWYVTSTDHAISGAQIAQSFLISNDVWCTAVGVWFAVKAANENVYVSVVECVNGVPDLSRTIAHVVLDHTNIKTGGVQTKVAIPPTFLARGGRYAVVITSNANHKIQIQSGEGAGYAEGTFFYSTDGSFYLGDLTKDIYLQLYGAYFRAPQQTIEFGVINLDGGFRNIDILAGMHTPDSTQVVFELRPSGAGEWMALTQENLSVLTNAPALGQFRARFVGTRNIQAGIKLAGSRVSVSRPKTTFKHVSNSITLAAASNEIHVVLTLEHFDDTPHDCTCVLRYGGADHSPALTTTTLLDATVKRYKRDFKFTTSSLSTFSIEISGSTNSAASMFHVAERVHYSL